MVSPRNLPLLAMLLAAGAGFLILHLYLRSSQLPSLASPTSRASPAGCGASCPFSFDSTFRRDGVEGQGPVGENPLDGCRHVYLDMGTNIGVQIRKLYEPAELFPDAGILPVFSTYFGPPGSRSRGSVCAVGWEPNPAHTAQLEELELSYKRCGWKVRIYTETGVGARELHGRYKAIDYAKKGDGIGGQMRDSWSEGDDTTPARTVRIAEFILGVVAVRTLPLGGDGPPPAVVMKLDVEGKEMEVMPDLVLSGALAHLDTLHVDWHLPLDWQDKDAARTKEAIELFTALGNRMNLTHVTQVDDKDDESYGDFSGDLPQC